MTFEAAGSTHSGKRHQTITATEKERFEELKIRLKNGLEKFKLVKLVLEFRAG